MRFRPYSLALVLGACLTTLQGCTGNVQGNGKGDGRIAIESDPPGAAVIADGQSLGTTPLRIVPGDVFPVGMVWGSKEGSGIASVRYKGKLRLEKSGCAPYSHEVDDYFLSKDIHVRLQCDQGIPAAPAPAPVSAVPAAARHGHRDSPARPQQPAAAAQGPQAATVTAVTRGDSAEARLLRIQTLRNKGLLNEEEYLRIRQTIIDGL